MSGHLDKLKVGSTVVRLHSFAIANLVNAKGLCKAILPIHEMARIFHTQEASRENRRVRDDNI